MAKTKINEKQILDAALQCFVRDGYNDTTIRKIAEKLGISHGSIFNYYESKADVALHIIDRFFSLWFEKSGKQTVGMPPLVHFAFLAATNFTFMMENRDFARFVCDYMSTNQDYYYKNTTITISEYISGYSSKYVSNHIKSSLDTLLLNNTSMKLISLLLDNVLNMHDACVYVVSLDNYLWALQGSEEDINTIVEDILSSPEHIQEAVQEMRCGLFSFDLSAT